jgi:hypothetical protein
LLCKIPTRDQLAGKTKQGAASNVKFGWQISIIKTMFTNKTVCYTVRFCVGGNILQLCYRTITIRCEWMRRTKTMGSHFNARKYHRVAVLHVKAVPFQFPLIKFALLIFLCYKY